MAKLYQMLHKQGYLIVHFYLLSFCLFFLSFTIACTGSDESMVNATNDVEEREQSVLGKENKPIGETESQITGQVSTSDKTETPAKSLVPELIGTGQWINAVPFTLQSQRGKVVLIDFWTYTCVNCIRTLPYLQFWHEKYAEDGLVVIGVHTPEFEFEKVFENIVAATEKFGLEYPVVQDNEFATWRAFGNSVWPAKYLVDKDGVIRYTHFGEGQYEETELAIRELLIETGVDVEESLTSPINLLEIDSDSQSSDPKLSQTRELYAGYLRNYGVLASGSQMPPYILDATYYEAPNTDLLYFDPGEHHNHFLYLQGLWHNESERLVHARTTENYEDYILVKFFATSANAVMDSVTGASFVVQVTIDDQPLALDQAGFDIEFDAEGNTFITVDEGRMYNLLNRETFGSGVIKLSSNSTEFSLFAITFGSYLGGEREY